MDVSDWIQFWKIALTIGLGSFALLVVIVIPLGAIDIVRLFKKLDSQTNSDTSRNRNLSSEND